MIKLILYGDGGVSSLLQDELENFIIHTDNSPAVENFNNKYCIVCINSPHIKFQIIQNLQKQNAIFSTFISKHAIVSKSAKIGKGVIIQKGAIINANAKIDDFVTIGTGAIVGHHSHIQAYSSINMRVAIAGYCKIGKKVEIGMNSILTQFSKVDDELFIKANSFLKGQQWMQKYKCRQWV